MIGAVLLVAGSLLVQVADRDIDWFDAHRQERAETLKRCHADYRLAYTAECENAEASGSRDLGRAFPPVPKPDPSKGKNNAQHVFQCGGGVRSVFNCRDG